MHFPLPQLAAEEFFSGLPIRPYGFFSNHFANDVGPAVASAWAVASSGLAGQDWLRSQAALPYLLEFDATRD
ncbi:MAG TPA: hypothetical protein VMI06_05225 [Terriglobia bacterium]|nr:hypothetical protein [Terriglobia bacterium]